MIAGEKGTKRFCAAAGKVQCGSKEAATGQQLHTFHAMQITVQTCDVPPEAVRRIRETPLTVKLLWNPANASIDSGRPVIRRGGRVANGKGTASDGDLPGAEIRSKRRAAESDGCNTNRAVGREMQLSSARGVSKASRFQKAVGSMPQDLSNQ